jgi:hypothetical protein
LFRKQTLYPLSYKRWLLCYSQLPFFGPGQRSLSQTDIYVSAFSPRSHRVSAFSEAFWPT